MGPLQAGTWEEKDCSNWATEAIKLGVKGVVATSASDASSMGAMLELMKVTPHLCTVLCAGKGAGS